MISMPKLKKMMNEALLRRGTGTGEEGKGYRRNEWRR